MTRTRIVALAAAVVAAIVGVNAVAYMQAQSMTRFASSGQRTQRPEELGWLEAARVVLTGVNIPRPENGQTPASVGLPFVVHRFPTADGQLLEAWYIPGTRERPLVIAFHGYAASKAALLPVAAALHTLGYPTLLVDFYGSGGSSGTGTSLGYLEAHDVAAAVDYARRSWPGISVVLYGFSMGGAAILRAVAVEDVRPDGVILEATFDTLLNTVRNRFRTMGLPGSPLAELLLFWGGRQWGFDAFTHNPAEYAAALRCPTLILHGTGDQRVPPEQAQHLKDASPEAALVLFPGVPHMLIVEAQPVPWTDAVDRFLARWQ